MLGDDDIDRCVELNNGSIPAVSEADRAKMVWLVEQSLLSLVVEHDGDVVGFCVNFGPGSQYGSVNYRWFCDRYDDFAYLDRIAVDPALRRSGVGRAFYAELIERFTGTKPVLLCEVNIRPRNDASLAFHRAIGFREVGQQDTEEGHKTVSLLELRLRRS